MTNQKKKALALAIGVCWGVMLFILTLISYYSQSYALNLLEVVRSVYVIYSITPSGAVIGFFLGFLDGFIGTYIIVSLYQFFEKKVR